MITLKRTLAKLAMLALSASPAAAAGDTVDSDDCELDASVPIDRGTVEARAAAALLGRSLADALAEMPPLEATHLVTTWALSSDRLRRLAVVEALRHVMPLGARSALAHLARDPDPDVRAAAAGVART
jgi:hypothetical protein